MTLADLIALLKRCDKTMTPQPDDASDFANATGIAALRNALPELRRELERFAWRPMQSAPRDGTEVLLAVEQRAGIPGKMLVGHYMPGGHCIEDHPPIADGWYFWNGCSFDKASKPLAWMPIPER